LTLKKIACLTDAACLTGAARLTDAAHPAFPALTICPLRATAAPEELFTLLRKSARQNALLRRHAVSMTALLPDELPL
jgi:hypothetical protein